jgi:hypothetical protein
MGGPAKKLAQRYYRAGSPICSAECEVPPARRGDRLGSPIRNRYQAGTNRARDDGRPVVLGWAGHCAPVDPRPELWPKAEKTALGLLRQREGRQTSIGTLIFVAMARMRLSDFR